LERDDFIQDTEGVFAHFGSGEEFGQLLGEVEAELKFVGRNGDADIVVAEDKAAVAAGDGTA
jgi:hypothetical protein